MPGSIGEIRVDGLAEVLRAFSRVSKDLAQDLVHELEEAVDPVRKKAEAELVAPPTKGLRNLPKTPYYSRMKIAVSRRDASVYIVPWWRASRARKRPQFADVVQPRIQETVEQSRYEIETGIERFLDKLSGEFNRY